MKTSVPRSWPRNTIPRISRQDVGHRRVLVSRLLYTLSYTLLTNPLIHSINTLTHSHTSSHALYYHTLTTHLQPPYQHTYNPLINAPTTPLSTGVFFVTRMDGVVDIWDYFYRQNEVAYSHKVGDCMLSSMAVQGMLPSPTLPHLLPYQPYHWLTLTLTLTVKYIL